MSSVEVSLQRAFEPVAMKFGITVDVLMSYAAEDNVGGRDTGNWPGAAIHADEGRFIYAIVRALKPKHCLEIGTDAGASTQHILAALEANKDGRLTSIDINPLAGTLINGGLRKRWEFIAGDALVVDLPADAEFVFEDGAHTYKFTVPMLQRLKALDPEVLVCHDYYAHEVYGGDFAVQRSFTEVFGGDHGVKLQGAFTGLGVYIADDAS